MEGCYERTAVTHSDFRLVGKRSPSHWQWSREPPSPQSLWMDHGVHPWRQHCPQKASCKPSLLHSPQHLPSDKSGTSVNEETVNSNSNLYTYICKHVEVMHTGQLTYSSSRLRRWSMASSTSSGRPVTVTRFGSAAPLWGNLRST